MLDYRASDIFQQLVRQGLAEQTAGTVGKARNEKLGERSEPAAHPRVTADAKGRNPAPAYELREGDHRSPIRLIVNNTSMRQTARSTASLTVVRN